MISRACALQQEKPQKGEARALQRVAPAHCSQGKPMQSSEDPVQPKMIKHERIEIIIIFF